ncbi:MAG: hypothetical protein IJP75_10740 [Bacteroidaceae bacterium]|nr:hypothetical protein [Bacteroidaceae bacterium]
MRRNESLIQDPLSHPLQAFVSDGLQLGDVLERLLQFSGVARVVVSTYSVGEEFLRRCHHLRKRGLISHLLIIADTKAADKTARLNVMVRRVADEVRLCQNHSKVLLVEGVKLSVLVLTSQNQTRGNRLENYTVIHNAAIMDSIIHSLNQLNTATVWKST